MSKSLVFFKNITVHCRGKYNFAENSLEVNREKSNECVVKGAFRGVLVVLIFRNKINIFYEKEKFG